MYLFAARLGISRLSSSFPKSKSLIQEAVKKFPEKIQKSYQATNLRTEMAKAFQSETVHFKESLNQVKGLNLHLDNKPLTVITAGIYENPYPMFKDSLDGWIKEMEKGWVELQKEHTMHSSMGKQIVAEQSNHLITRNQPEIIVDAIKEIVELSHCSDIQEN